VTVFLHVLINLQEYGAPPVLWLWFGVIAFFAVVLSYATGYLRTSSRALFQAVHYGLGVFSIALVLLHWAWAWL
jgi:hypothetical protein